MRVTLADVARAAGVSVAGASYALRGDRSIPARTVEKVRRIAAELGYRPDLRVSSLMATIRRGRALQSRETLAFVWIDTPRRTERLPVHLQHFVRVILASAQERAEQLGCTLEQFWLDERTMPAARLHGILRARGISGVIISPAASEQAVSLDWDWAPFASAIVGTTEISPVLNRSAHHHYRSVWLTLERLRSEGYSRPAAILSQTVQERIHSMQLAAFLTNHPDPDMSRSAVRFSQPDAFAGLGGWLRRVRPDALVLGWQLDCRQADQLQALAPRVRRMVTLDWHPGGVLPGIDPCNAAIAAQAVDLVIAQLHRSELGRPAQPTTVLTDGVWRETAS
jgi:LacI family transcriptional regulator